MTLTLIGVNHRTAPVELRERLSIAKGSEADVLRPLCSNGGIRGSAVISTSPTLYSWTRVSTPGRGAGGVNRPRDSGPTWNSRTRSRCWWAANQC